MTSVQELRERLQRGGRSEYNGLEMLQVLVYPLHIRQEPQVERLVELIEYESLNSVKRQPSASDVVEQTSGSGYDYIGLACERILLRFERVASIKRGCLVGRQCENSYRFEDLECEFAGWRNYKTCLLYTSDAADD